MSFDSWKERPLVPIRDLKDLSAEELANEHTRTEIEKMRVEILDERSWRTKLLLSLVIPLGGALAFLSTWYNDRSTDRAHRSDQLYTDAAQQLSNSGGSAEASVRLNAVLTLSSFVTERGRLAQLFYPSKEGDCGAAESARGRQSIALVVGHLAAEPESSVLDAISDTAKAHPCLTAKPLLSVDRSAAVQFARAAGTFAGLYTLKQKKKTAIAADDPDFDKLEQTAIQDVSAITLRTGSPFEAKDILNERFVARTFLSPKCPFYGLFDNEFRLAISAGLNDTLLGKVLSVTMVHASLEEMESAAAILEKASYVLGGLARTDRGMTQLPHGGDDNLYGAAIVVGEMDKTTIASLQSRGAYVQQYGVDGVCAIPPAQ